MMRKVIGGCGGVPPALGVSRVMVMLLAAGAALLQVPRVEGVSRNLQTPHCTRNHRKNATIAINKFFTLNNNPYGFLSVVQLDYSGLYDLNEINNVELFRGTSAWKLDQTCSNASLQEENSLPKKDKFELHNLCPLYMDIRVYAVKQNGRVLNGWLHIEVQMKDTSNPEQIAEYFYVEVQDENFNAIGELIVDEPWECQPSTDKIRSLSKYHNFPCFATAPREHQASTAIFIARESCIDYENENEGKARKISNLTSKADTEGLHFMWRLSEYWCNRHEKFRVMAIVRPYGAWCNYKNNGACPYFASVKQQMINQRKVTDWFYPRWYGAADIRLEGHDKNGKKHDLDCKSLAAEYDKTSKEYKLTHDGATWIEKVEKYSLRTDYYNLLSVPVSDQHRQYSGSCQYTFFGNAGAAFNGRCEKDRTSSVNADRSVAQFCDKNEFGNSSAYRNLNISIFTNYTEYKTNILTYRLTPPCVKTCNVPSTKADAEKIKKQYPELTKKKKAKLDWSTIKRLRAPKRATLIWTCRKIHGEVCLFIVLFLMPVSIFLSRYYKETFMSVRWYGCAPWYWVHVGIALTAFYVFLTGRRSLYAYYANWGYSTEDPASTHRILGNFTIIIFLVLSCTGFNRPVANLPRIIYLGLHAILGFLTYIISLVLVITSQDIKYTPSGNGCPNGTTTQSTELSNTASITIAWIALDIIFHIGMTAMQFLLDKRHKIVRIGCGFPFIAFLPLEYNRDFRGGGVRKIVLIIYITIAFIVSFYAIIDLAGRKRSDFESCEFGDMSCDLEVKGQELGCHSVSLSYRKVLNKRYNNETDE